MFEAYITNTALYPLMGIEVGTTVHFPMTTQELQAALAKIGIDGKRYSEVFFTSFDSDVLGLYDYLYECENIDELNELGHALLEVRDKGGLETFEAALVLGNHTRSVKDLINLTQNLDLYRFYPDISDDEGLGRLYADELGTIDIPEHIQNYFDYEAYGRDVRINEGGVFAPGGYVSAVPEGFKEYYHGPQDIPPEHRIFAYPEKAEPVHSILAALKRFQEAPPAPKKDKAGPSHEERYRLRTYRHKAYYSLDRDDGLEHEAVFVALSPHELYERKVTMQELHAAISSLPDKQAKRIYAHFILGMTKQDIARAEGVHEKVVRVAIERGLRRLEKILKNSL